eukprot:scaffold22522_cov54-Phaeocystis_antarctica.AAC.5
MGRAGNVSLSLACRPYVPGCGDRMRSNEKSRCKQPPTDLSVRLQTGHRTGLRREKGYLWMLLNRERTAW